MDVDYQTKNDATIEAKGAAIEVATEWLERPQSEKIRETREAQFDDVVAFMVAGYFRLVEQALDEAEAKGAPVSRRRQNFDRMSPDFRFDEDADMIFVSVKVREDPSCNPETTGA